MGFLADIVGASVLIGVADASAVGVLGNARVGVVATDLLSLLFTLLMIVIPLFLLFSYEYMIIMVIVMHNAVMAIELCQSCSVTHKLTSRPMMLLSVQSHIV